MRPFRLSRRAVLRGLGATIALPVLDAMLDDRGRLHGVAHAQGMEAPVCLVTWFFAHGTKMDAWTPPDDGARWTPTPCLAPLDAHRGDLLVLTGLANPAPELLSSVGGPHSRGAASWASGMPTSATGAGGPTFERLAAAELGGATRFRALSVVNAPEAPGVESGSSAMLTNLSWSGPSRPAPATRDPAQLFAQLFGSVRSDGSGGSVLDHVRGELLALQSRVGRDDRARLEEHLGAVRDMERAATPGAACSPGVAPPDATLPPPESARLLLRLITAALRCDLTRFASFALSNALNNSPLPWLGLNDGHHDLSHQDDHDTIVRITRDAMEHAAFFLGELAAARDARGRLLDRCLVFISSEVSDGARHDYRDLPVIVAGRGGGVAPGAHLRVAPHTSICRLYLSLLQRAGARVDRFGLDGESPLALP
jgi:hypothetical protein